VLHNFRRAFHLSSGRFFRWHGHDDWIDPGYLAAQLRVLEADPSAAATLTDVVFVDGEGTPFLTHREAVPGAAAADARTRLHAVLWGLRSHSTLAFSLARRTAMERTGLLRDIPEAAKVLAVELALEGRLPFVPGPRLNRTFDDTHRDRDHWVWLDPRNAGRRPLATPRQLGHHARAVVRAGLSPADTSLLLADVLVSQGWRRSTDKARLIVRKLTGRPWTAPL
jgi:hypothetical protein